jgi:Helix-turn-helix domain
MPQCTTSSSTRPRGTFAQTPVWVTQRVSSGTALRIYEHLAAKYCNDTRFCFPYQTSIARDLGYGLRTVERAFKTLYDASAVIVAKSHKLNGHYGRNAYILPMVDPRDSAAPSEVDQATEQASSTDDQGSDPPYLAGRQPDPQDFTTLDQNQDREPKTRSNDEHCASAPSPRSGDAGVMTSQDPKNLDETSDQTSLDQHKSQTPLVQARVETPVSSPRQSGTEVATGPAVGTQLCADDHGGGGDQPKTWLVGPDAVETPDPQWLVGLIDGGMSADYEAFMRRMLRHHMTLHDAFPGYRDPDLEHGCDWEEQRRERLKDLIENKAEYLPPGYEHVIESMLDQGAHWMKIVNTLEKWW